MIIKIAFLNTITGIILFIRLPINEPIKSIGRNSNDVFNDCNVNIPNTKYPDKATTDVTTLNHEKISRNCCLSTFAE